MVNTPILFETFVRDDYARRVFDAIKEAKPRKLYFYSNKGREKGDEIERNNRIRSWVDEIDWECELHTFFRDECVDIYTSLKGAIDWVFENEECAIILEDDIVPTLAFFDFCDQMIKKFKNDRRVWYVSGANFENYNPSGYDYLYSRYFWAYGWATWRDRWLSVPWDDPKIDEFVKSENCIQLYKTKEQQKFREKQLLGLRDFLKRTKCWDYMFGLTADQNNACGVLPKKHLITNVGVMGAHNKRKIFVHNDASYNGERYVINQEPPFVFADVEYDYRMYKLKNSFEIRLKRAVSGLILKCFGKKGLNRIKSFISH